MTPRGGSATIRVLDTHVAFVEAAKCERAEVDVPDAIVDLFEALIKTLGGSVSEREGSRLKIELKGEQWRCHRPHPGKEAKRYQVEEARELLERVGVLP